VLFISAFLSAKSDKRISLNLEGLKIFIKPHVFLFLAELFVESLPVYQDNSEEKPNFFDSNESNAPSIDCSFSMQRSLVCFFNDRSAYTLALRGDINAHYLQETLNEKKIALFMDPRLPDQGKLTDKVGSL